jgi:hypothetical protein
MPPQNTETMSWFDEIIKAQGRSGIVAYKSIRLSLSFLSPLFVISGVWGLLDSNNKVFSDGSQILGLEHSITLSGFIVLGILLGLLRITIFNKKYIGKAT